MSQDVFERVQEIANSLSPDRWMLVGGLMVHAHAQLAGVQHARPTDDVDLVVEVRAGSYAQAAAVLRRLRYVQHEPLDRHAPFHRFTCGREHVDLMGTAMTSRPRKRTGLSSGPRLSFGAQSDHRLRDRRWRGDPHP